MIKIKDFLKLLDEDQEITIFGKHLEKTYFAQLVKDFGKSNKSKRIVNMEVCYIWTDDCIDGLCIEIKDGV